MYPIGIDLGTTHSLVAVWQDGAPQLIPNALGEVLTPSAVWADAADTLLIGRAALDRWLTEPARGAVAFKRQMGTAHTWRLGSQRLRAEELSALVLRSLREDAERHLGAPVTDAVISVPAYFSDAQRQATRQAGELAGLTVRRLVNEPTAAALAYGLHDQSDESTFMVLDLGGGTFDVSILERFAGVMEVRASTGDNFLGGEDFTRALMLHARAQWPDLPDPDTDAQLHARLWREAERAKRIFSQGQTQAELNLVWQDQHHRLTITDTQWAQLAEPLLARLRRPVERALGDAKLRAGDLHQIVLAGGATRMPLVRRLAGKLFGRLPAMHLNPDEVVARGAAVMAGLLARDAALEEVVMTDVCPYSLGTSVSERLPDGSLRHGLFMPLIERNSVVPISREERFYTIEDQQQRIHIDVYQGEARLVADNIRLGALDIDVPRRPAGEVQVDVRFTYDSSGLLDVDVQVPGTDIRAQTAIQRHASALNPADVAKRLKAMAALKVHPRDQQVNQAVLARAERLHMELLGAPRRALADAVLAFEAAMASQDPKRVAIQRALLEQTLRQLEPDHGL